MKITMSWQKAMNFEAVAEGNKVAMDAKSPIGRGTAIAVGKYLGRRFFVELVTDGHGYSASSAEFRLTRFLSILGTVSTLYDKQLTLKITRDY